MLANFKVFNLLLAERASNKYIVGSLGQLKISGSQRPLMICCGLWPQLPKLFIFEKELFVLVAVKWISTRKGVRGLFHIILASEKPP